MNREELSELITGKLLQKKIAPMAVSVDDLLSPYSDIARIVQDETGWSIDEIIQRVGYFPVDRAMAAAEHTNGVSADWPRLLHRVAVRDVVGSKLERASQVLRRGDSYEPAELVKLARQLAGDIGAVETADNVKSEQMSFRKTFWHPIDAFVGGIPKAGLTVVGAPPGCLTGDAVVGINRKGKSFNITLKDLVYKFNGGAGSSWDLNYPTKIRARHDDGAIRLVTLERAIYSGDQQVYEITTEDNNSIRATWDHPILTDHGWEKLTDLKIGSLVFVEGERQIEEKIGKLSYLTVEGLQHHPFAGRQGCGRYTVLVHRVVMDAYINGIPYDEFINRCRCGDVRGLKFLDPKRFSVHHKNKDCQDNNFLNLEVLERIEHLKQHGAVMRGWGALPKTKLSKIVSIKKCGIEPTYDLTLAKHPHNFLANGIVVHNTGKTSLLVKMAAIAARNGKKSLLFSMEMTGPQLMHRMLATQELTLEERRLISISDDILMPSEVASIAALTPDIDDMWFIGIDFAELMMVGGRDNNTEAIMGRIYLDMSRMAKYLRIPIVLLSQLNRNYQGGLPQITHLRYSGMAEAVASLILLIYNRKAIFVRQDSGGALPDVKDKAWLIVGKSRYGHNTKYSGRFAIQVGWTGKGGWGDTGAAFPL